MQQATEQRPTAFVDRRQPFNAGPVTNQDRRQFQDSRGHLSLEAIELAEAVDQYKLRHRRRFITFEELYDVMSELGYHK